MNGAARLPGRTAAMNLSGRPAEIRTVHGYLVNYMQMTVDAYSSFAAGDPEYAVTDEAKQAADYEDQFVTALASLKVTGRLP